MALLKLWYDRPAPCPRTAVRLPGGAQPLEAAQHTRGGCHAHTPPLSTRKELVPRLLTSMLPVGPAEWPGPRAGPSCSGTAGHLCVARTPLPPGTVPGHCARWHHQRKDRQFLPGPVDMSYPLQKSSPQFSATFGAVTICRYVYLLLFCHFRLCWVNSPVCCGKQGLPQAFHSSCLWILSVCPAAGGTISPGKLWVSCQGETWTTDS